MMCRRHTIHGRLAHVASPPMQLEIYKDTVKGALLI